MTLDEYWETIPVGRENAVSYTELAIRWGVHSNRVVRNRLHQLSAYDNGDGLVLIRSSNWCGFYRTDDRDEIAAYRQEVYNRARRTFAPFKKINRILGTNENQMIIDL